MPYNQPNFKRMLQLIDEVFATRKDKNQLQITEAEMEKLKHLHSSTLSEISNEDGPTAWVLMIPTTEETMQQFLTKKITETQLLAQTEIGQNFTCLYLCSATTLPEFRGKGNTKRLCLNAIESLLKSHPINTLYVWPFTNDGKTLANSIADACKLPIKFLE